jgi:DNA-binding MarR family transcriptional regulator
VSKVLHFPERILPDEISDADIETTEVVVPRLARSRAAGHFLRGPIPWCDLSKAAALGGKALALFLAIHHQCALRRSRTVKLPGSLLASLSIGRKAAADALDRLERAGLITVERHNKSKPVITLVHKPAKEQANVY